MVGAVGVNPIPVAVITHDPLGRAMTEEQKTRLREQPLPPVEETVARERIVDKRHDGAPRKRPAPGEPEEDDTTPGHLIDSYV